MPGRFIIQICPRLTCSTSEAAVAAVLGGAGIARLLSPSWTRSPRRLIGGGPRRVRIGQAPCECGPIVKAIDSPSAPAHSLTLRSNVFGPIWRFNVADVRGSRGGAAVGPQARVQQRREAPGRHRRRRRKDSSLLQLSIFPAYALKTVHAVNSFARCVDAEIEAIRI